MTQGFFPPQRPAPIGTFQIGVSPIGTVTAFAWQDTVISQYANSQRLLSMLENLNAYIDQTQNFDNFFDLLWNLDTAVGYGLDVWGRILNIKRTLPVDAGDYFGFEEAVDAGEVGFNQEPFYSGPPTTDNYTLSDDAYRLLLFAKAAMNICEDSISAINRLLMNLFPNRGNAYAQEGSGIDEFYFGFNEGGPGMAVGFNQEPFYSGQVFTTEMHMQYIFKFQLTPVELSIVTNSGVLPTPTGVKAHVYVVP